jgi:hypothetical protein
MRWKPKSPTLPKLAGMLRFYMEGKEKVRGTSDE